MIIDITSNDELPECDKEPTAATTTLVGKKRMRPRLNVLTKFVKVAFSPRYLLYTNVTISFCLSGMGDAMEQQYELMTGQLEHWDAVRTRRMSVTGIPIGVVCHHCYRVIDYALPGRTLSVVAKKVLLDQLLCSPISISTFFIAMGVQEGKCFADFIAEFRTKAWRLYLAEWVLWPPAQFVNFYILPAKYRVLYDNIISLGYDVYASHVKHHKDDEEVVSLRNDTEVGR